jgi:hypothetical protein
MKHWLLWFAAVRTVLEHVFERQEVVPLLGMYRCAMTPGGTC